MLQDTMEASRQLPSSRATAPPSVSAGHIPAASGLATPASGAYRISILHHDMDELPVLEGLLIDAGYAVRCHRFEAVQRSPPADSIPDLILVQSGSGPGRVSFIPSILMTTEAELADPETRFPLHDDMLVRPLRASEVLARIAAVLDRRTTPVPASQRAAPTVALPAAQYGVELPDRLVFEANLAMRVGTAVPLQAPPTAVVVIALDRLREVNTVFGYQEGDAALAEAGRRLRACLSAADLFARIGTDLFAAALDGIDDDGSALSRASEMVRSLQGVRTAGGETLALGAIAGISVHPSDACDAEGLLRRASVALQDARSAGPGQVRLFRPEGQPLQTRLQLARDLHAALRDQDFTLHYQPQIMLRTGAICGVEALLRWTHPQFGNVPPASFIPLAEEQGLMCGIGRNTLAMACTQAARWQRAGYPPFRMAVNLSPAEFYSDSLVEDVAAILRDAGLEPHWLELEITEAMPLDDLGSAIRIMRELKQLGVSLAVDDFGTGWSSLAYLRHFPLDRLKIDRSFTRDVTRAADAAAITRTVIGLSGNLDVACMAEGIENIEQLDWLRDQGCTEGQGYLISRPMTADAITRLLDLQAARPARSAMEPFMPGLQA